MQCGRYKVHADRYFWGMSSHCVRYPICGCSKEIGEKCHWTKERYESDVAERLAVADGVLVEKPRAIGFTEAVKRNDKGYPLLENGEIDWAKTSEEKGEYLKKHEAKIRSSGDPWADKRNKGKHGTNYTPPKRRHRKK